MHRQKAGAGAEALHGQGWLVRRGEAVRNPSAELLGLSPMEAASNTRRQEQSVAAALVSNSFQGTCTRVWGPRESCNELRSCRKKGKTSGAEPDPGIPGMQLAPQNTG